MSAGAVALIAGGGELPRLIAAMLRRAGVRYHVIGIQGFVGTWLSEHPHDLARIDRPGRVFAAAQQAGCDRVCFAGHVRRPAIWQLRPDLTGFWLLWRILWLFRKGDDGLLRGIARIFEERGLRLVGAHEILPQALAPLGQLGCHAPAADAPLHAAQMEALALGAADLGQAVIVDAQGRVVAKEGREGTDAMLAAAPPTPRGVLAKFAKPGQERRLDLPTIGPETIRGAAALGLAGVVIEAGNCFVIDRDGCVALADEAGLFVVGVTA